MLRRLEARYGAAVWRPTGKPVDTLVACILSQHTSDKLSERAFNRLKHQYDTWDSVADAEVSRVAEAIRQGGLAETKARRIQECLQQIREREGSLDLRKLALVPLEDATAYLEALPGVGPKTAAIVLCFALGRPALPVDTHVFRTSWRLGLIQRKIGATKAHIALSRQVEDDDVFRFHVAMISLGKDVCRAQRPRCAKCPLIDLCPSAADSTAAETLGR